MTTIYFVRHAQPNYENHDDLSRELTRQGLTGGPYTAWMLGPLDSCKIDITYPAATVGMAARVLKIVI